MALHFLYATTLLLVIWSGVNGQFAASECGTLRPTTGNVQTGTAPFFVASASTSYTPGGPPVLVFLASTSTVTASSVILQARRAGSPNNAAVGSFTVPSNLFELLQCGSSSTGTIISSNTDAKTLNLQFMWTPPAQAVGNVEFIASLVETNNNAWVGVTSLNPVTGPAEEVVPLTIGQCPTPNVNANGVGTYTSPSCSRGASGAGTAVCAPPSGTTFPTGTTTVTCTCTDTGETDSCSFNVIVTPAADGCNPSPCLNGGTCFSIPAAPNGFFCSCVTGTSGTRCENGGTGPGPLTVTPCPPDLNNFGNVFIWTSPNCVRDGNVVGQSTCSPPSGATFMGAVNSVTCTCTAGDEQATCPFNVNAGPAGPACANNPCALGNECRETTSALAGYTCHSSTGQPCIN